MHAMYDIVIVGAGPGGSAAAHFLAQRGLKVLLLDKAEFPRDKTCGDGLTPRALSVLDEMGIMDKISEAGFRINGIELHAKAGNMMAAPIPDHAHYPNFLMVVPRLQLDEIIRQQALHSGADFELARVRGVEQQENHVTVSADRNGKRIKYKGRVAILAIGANMRMLHEMEILHKPPQVLLAARAYYEGMQGLNDYVQAHFANVPLPGYGWVFPISDSTANVGVGYWQTRNPLRKMPVSARHAMVEFLNNPRLKKMLRGAERIGPIKSYPLRIDFTSAPSHKDRVLLVGESAGLVSPLTGEGIDFALESGKLAAEFLSDRFEKGELSTPDLASYDSILRQNFQHIFRFLDYGRRVYVNPLLMERAVNAANKYADVKRVLVNVMMSQQDPVSLLSLTLVRRIVLGV